MANVRLNDFQRGFGFALAAVRSLGVDVDVDRLRTHLEELAAGDLTLMPTDAELRSAAEPGDERDVAGMIDHRRDITDEYRTYARTALAMFPTG